MYPEPSKVLMQHFDKIHHMKLSECPNFNLNWSLTWTVLMSVQDKGKRSHLSCQMTARRASGQSEARVVLLGTGRSGDWTTWRATARQQRVKMNSCSATGNTHFHTHSHTKSSFLHIWLIVFLWSSTLKLRGWGFWSVRCRWWWGGRWRCGQRRGQLREWVPRQTGIETCA